MISLPSWLKPNPTLPPADNIKPGTLDLPLGFSWQNPAWNADGTSLSLTRFMRYNEGASNVFTFNLATRLRGAVSDGVSQPGNCWHPTSGIIFSREADKDDEGDGIWSWCNGKLTKLFGERDVSAYEPSWSPDGSHFCFELHPKGKDDQGRIACNAQVFGGCIPITAEGLDCRQPMWDVKSNRIVYQRNIGKDHWQLFVQRPANNAGPQNITRGTDATWTPTSELLFSGEDGLLHIANLSSNTVRPVGGHGGYKGAPSMSPNGQWIACEASDRDPDGGPGTHIEIMKVQT